MLFTANSVTQSLTSMLLLAHFQNSKTKGRITQGSLVTQLGEYANYYTMQFSAFKKHTLEYCALYKHILNSVKHLYKLGM